MKARKACRWIVTALRLAFEYDEEEALGRDLLIDARAGKLASITELQGRYLTRQTPASSAVSPQHELASDDELLPSITGGNWSNVNPESEVPS